MSLATCECLTCFAMVGSAQEGRDSEDDLGFVCGDCLMILCKGSDTVRDIAQALKQCDIDCDRVCNICQKQKVLAWRVPMCNECQKGRELDS